MVCRTNGGLGLDQRLLDTPRISGSLGVNEPQNRVQANRSVSTVPTGSLNTFNSDACTYLTNREPHTLPKSTKKHEDQFETMTMTYNDMATKYRIHPAEKQKNITYQKT